MQDKDNIIPDLKVTIDNNVVRSTKNTGEEMINYYKKSLESSKVNVGNNRLAEQAEKTDRQSVE